MCRLGMENGRDDQATRVIIMFYYYEIIVHSLSDVIVINFVSSQTLRYTCLSYCMLQYPLSLEYVLFPPW